MKLLIVDGYNAIYKIPAISKMMDSSLEEARNALTKLADEFRRRDGGIAEVFVVFDGRDEYRGLSFKRSNQVFSKTGEGDREIIKLVQRKSDKYHVIVASDDNFVRNSSRASGATVVSIAEFAALAEKKLRRGCGADKGGQEKAYPDKAEEINEDLRRHWKIS